MAQRAASWTRGGSKKGAGAGGAAADTLQQTTRTRYTYGPFLKSAAPRAAPRRACMPCHRTSISYTSYGRYLLAHGRPYLVLRY